MPDWVSADQYIDVAYSRPQKATFKPLDNFLAAPLYIQTTIADTACDLKANFTRETSAKHSRATLITSVRISHDLEISPSFNTIRFALKCSSRHR